MKQIRKPQLKFIALLFILITDFSCQQKSNTSDIITINIDEIEDDTSIKFSDVFQDYQVIPLYPSGDSVLGQIDHISILNDRIITCDRWKYNGVLVYNLEGKLISGIKKKGRGPGEYNTISCIDIDTVSQQILISDYRNKLCIYDYVGTHVRDIKVDNPFTDIAYLDSKIYLCCTMESDVPFMITDHNGEILKTFHDLDLNRARSMVSRINGDFYNYRDNLYLSLPFHNTIYKVGKDKLRPYIKIESLEFGKPIDVKQNAEGIRQTVLKTNNCLRSFSMNDRIIFFTIREIGKFGRKKFFYFIDRGQAYGSYLKDDMTFASSEFIQLFGNKMITYLRPEQALWLKGKIKDGAINVPPRLADALAKINYENYYPILIIYDLKEEFDF